MTKSLTHKERDVAAYFDANIDGLLDPYASLSSLEARGYRAYERYWRYEARRFGKLLQNKRVLSLGTGTAADEAMFREQGIDYVGIDISEKVLQGAMSRIPRPKVVRMNMRNLGFANNSFGGIWSFDSSSYIPKEHIGEVLSEAHRVIQPEGYLYVSVLLGEGALYEEGIGDVQYWQPDEFERNLSDSGFRVTNLRPDSSLGSAAFIAQPVKS